jgi:hypothetical protein
MSGSASDHGIRKITGAQELSVGSVVETALKSYMAEYRAIVAGGKKLREKRDRLLPFVSTLGIKT